MKNKFVGLSSLFLLFCLNFLSLQQALAGSINITYPANNQILIQPASMDISVTGTVTLPLVFKANGTVIGTVDFPVPGTTNTYAYNWAFARTGNYTITVTDSSSPANTASVNVVVTEATVVMPPATNVDSNGNPFYTAGGNINLTAITSTVNSNNSFYSSSIKTDPNMVKLTFYYTTASNSTPTAINTTALTTPAYQYIGENNGTAVDELGPFYSTLTWNYAWDLVPSGTYTITAVATDSGNNTFTSGPVTITVAAVSGTPPVIPTSRTANGLNWIPGETVGVPGGIPPEIPIATLKSNNPGQVIDVTKAPYNADNTGATDASYAINSAINAAQPGQIVYLPTGTYWLSGTPTQGSYGPVISIGYNKNHLTLRGDGVDKTIINCSGFNNPDGTNDLPACIGISGEVSNSFSSPPINPIPVTSFNTSSGQSQGATNLTINTTSANYSAFSQGNLVWIFTDNDVTEPVISVYGYPQTYSEVTMVTNVSSDGKTITINPPLLPGFNPSATTVIQSGQASSFVGVQDMTVDASSNPHVTCSNVYHYVVSGVSTVPTVGARYISGNSNIDPLTVTGMENLTTGTNNLQSGDLYTCSNSSTVVSMPGSGAGILTKASGTGDSTLSFSWSGNVSNKPTPFGIELTYAYGDWIDNVKFLGLGNFTVSFGTTVNSEMRHSYLGALNHAGSNGAGLLFGSSVGNLIEDNTMLDSFPMWEINSSSGNVFGYNFVFESGEPLDFNHEPHGAYNLIEGNIMPVMESDSYYGSDSDETFFRNWIMGAAYNTPAMDTSLTKNTIEASQVVAMTKRFNRDYSFIGNILGTSDLQAAVNATLNSGLANPYLGFGYPNIGNPFFYGFAQASHGQYWSDWDPMNGPTIRATLSATDSSDGTIDLISGGSRLYAEYQFTGTVWLGPDWGTGKRMSMTATLPTSVSLDEYNLGPDSGYTVGLSGGAATGDLPGDLTQAGQYVQIWPRSEGFQEYDLDTLGTTLLEDNYYATNPSPTDPTATLMAGDAIANVGGVDPSTALSSAQSLPNSLYSTQEPAWFGNLTWPPINPANPVQSLVTIPAGYRYFNNGADVPGFNANAPVPYTLTINQSTGTTTSGIVSATMSVTLPGSSTPVTLQTPISCYTSSSNSCSFFVNPGTTLTLNATGSSSTCSTFTGFSGACSGTGTCSITMNSNQTVTAAYSVPGSCNAGSGGGGGGATAVCSISIPHYCTGGTASEISGGDSTTDYLWTCTQGSSSVSCDIPKPTGAGSSITTGLNGWWKFDEQSVGLCPSTSNYLLDSSGLSPANPGTCITTSGVYPSYIAGISTLGQGALQLTSISNDTTGNYVSLPATAGVYNQTTGYSISLWEKTTSAGQGALYSEIEGSGHVPVSMAVSNERVQLFVDGGALQITSGGQASASYQLVDDGKWHHIVWTDQPGTGAQAGEQIGQLYIDGYPDPGYTSSGTSYAGWSYTPNSTYTASTPITSAAIGATLGQWGSFGFFNGSIDDVRVYKTALSASQVQSLYLLGEPNLGVVYGDVNGDGNVTIYDAELTAQAAVGLITFTAAQQTAAEVDGSGKVDIYDAYLIAKYAVGIITQFPAQNN